MKHVKKKHIVHRIRHAHREHSLFKLDRSNIIMLLLFAIIALVFFGVMSMEKKIENIEQYRIPNRIPNQIQYK